jgi:hypothetical protein
VAQPKRKYKSRSRRSGGNALWFGLAAVIVIIGAVLIVLSRPDKDVPPLVSNPDNAGGAADHWHAALGLYDCDSYLQGWDTTKIDNRPVRAGTDQYAGLHSHADGLIHIEPSSSQDSGENATLGTYADFAGWDISDDSVDMAGLQHEDGDKCGDKPGELRWSVNGEEQSGDPGDYKVEDQDQILIAYVPEGTDLSKLPPIPSLDNLENPTEGEHGNTNTIPPNDSTAPTSPTTGGSSTTAPSGDSSTTAPSGDSSTTAPTTAATTPSSDDTSTTAATTATTTASSDG